MILDALTAVGVIYGIFALGFGIFVFARLIITDCPDAPELDVGEMAAAGVIFGLMWPALLKACIDPGPF